MQQEVQKKAVKFDHVTLITMTEMAVFVYTRAARCLSFMLFRDELNPADIVQLHKLYASSDPPFVLRIQNYFSLNSDYCPIVLVMLD